MNELEELQKRELPYMGFPRRTDVDDRFPSKEFHRKCYFRSVREGISFHEPVGKWMIPCDCNIKDYTGMTELDKVWKVATDLFIEKFFIKVICFTRAHTSKQVSASIKYVNCFVENYEDVESVIRSASELRKRCDNFPYPFYFKTHQKAEDNTQKVVLRYMCCVDGDFYKFDGSDWNILNTL